MFPVVSSTVASATLPSTGFVRLSQILGKPKSNPPIPAIVPVSKSTWWEGVRTGRFPTPVKLGPRTTVWYVSDILDLIAKKTTVVNAPPAEMVFPDNVSSPIALKTQNKAVA